MKIVKILWIDDSQAWAESAQDNLTIVGQLNDVDFKFFNTINGEDTLYQCAIYDLDIIVMDYDMTPFSGDKYIADVRAEEHLEHIPILFYSQNNSIDLSSLVHTHNNVLCLFRPNLEEEIRQRYCSK